MRLANLSVMALTRIQVMIYCKDAGIFEFFRLTVCQKTEASADLELRIFLPDGLNIFHELI